MRIALASDHAGFSLKQEVRETLEAWGHEVQDFGVHTDDTADYPDFGIKVAQAVAEKKADQGVVICGSGIGMCIVANKVHGVRAAVLRDEEDARLSREHNDANVACLGGRMTDALKAKHLLKIFLKTPFAGGRHTARVAKIEPA